MELINTLNYCTQLFTGSEGIPDSIANIIHYIFLILQIVVPILLIIWGMLDFAKAVMAQDEDKIKEGQKRFIQRLIAAIIVFLIVTIVQLVISLVAGVTEGDSTNATDANKTWKCANCLIQKDSTKCQ